MSNCPSMFSANGPQCDLPEGHLWPSRNIRDARSIIHFAEVVHEDGTNSFFTWFEIR